MEHNIFTVFASLPKYEFYYEKQCVLKSVLRSYILIKVLANKRSDDTTPRVKQSRSLFLTVTFNLLSVFRFTKSSCVSNVGFLIRGLSLKGLKRILSQGFWFKWGLRVDNFIILPLSCHLKGVEVFQARYFIAGIGLVLAWVMIHFLFTCNVFNWLRVI